MDNNLVPSKAYFHDILDAEGHIVRIVTGAEISQDALMELQNARLLHVAVVAKTPATTIYYWETLLASGRVLTIQTKKRFSSELCKRIQDEVGGDFLDALVEELQVYRDRRTKENANV